MGGADKKWKGNFWFCFAVSVSEKSNHIITFLFALFSTLTATEAQYKAVCAKAQSYLICACPARPVRAHKPQPFLGKIIKRRGLLPSIFIIVKTQFVIYRANQTTQNYPKDKFFYRKTYAKHIHPTDVITRKPPLV